LIQIYNRVYIEYVIKVYEYNNSLNALVMSWGQQVKIYSYSVVKNIGAVRQSR